MDDDFYKDNPWFSKPRCQPDDIPSEVVTYQPSNRNRYTFSFETQKDWSIRAYIEHMPSYGSCDANLHMTHRNKDGDRYYVDWVTPLHSEEDARKVAEQWAKQTDRYIKTGKPFGP